MKKIAILASGDGSNAESIVKYFENIDDVSVEMVLSNRASAGVHERMARLGIPTITFSKQQWNESIEIMSLLKEKEIDFIVLAGFLAIIQPRIIEAYVGRIVNIHPSLLPRHGGSGMWGMNVHRAVLNSGDNESGITIHYVDAEVDGGDIIAQYRCKVLENDVPETLAERIHQLEHFYYPREIHKLLNNSNITD